MEQIVASPDNIQLRADYASAIRSGEPDRADFIDAQLGMTNTASREARTRFRLQSELLLRRHREDWLPAWEDADRKYIAGYEFHNGLVELLDLSAEYFLNTDSTALLKASPVRHLNLSGTAGHWERLHSDPRFVGIRSLSVSDDGLTDTDLDWMARSTTLSDIWWLGLSHNAIEETGVAQLAQRYRAAFPQLQYVCLTANPCDPIEQYSLDGDLIAAKWLPAFGQALEAKHGEIPWLHIHGNNVRDITPHRFHKP